MISSTSICHLVIIIIVATYCHGCMEYLTNLTPIAGDPSINDEWGNYPALMGDGNTYDEQMVIHPPENGQAYVEWNLNAEYLRFTAVIGPIVDHAPCGTRLMRFIISVDGVVVYTSQDFSSKTQYANIDIDVTGKNILRITTDAVGSNCADHATVANPILTCAQWNLVTSPPIPNSNWARAVGYDSQSQLVWLVGGYPNYNQLLSFDVSSKTYVGHADIPFGGYHSGGQSYVQKDNSLYMVMGGWWYNTTGSQLYQYDMSTMVSHELKYFPMHHGERGCLTYIDNYLILVHESTVWTYDINLDSWLRIYPATSIFRNTHSCQISNEKYLYVVGGASGATTDIVYKLYVGDITNINNYDWIQLNARISSPRMNGHSVIYNNRIYYIGGNVPPRSNAIDIIDATNDEINTGIGVIYEGISEHNVISIGNTIYVFGGRTEANVAVTYHQYYQLPNQLSVNPTQTPTTEPTNVPTDSPTYKVCNPQELDWNELNTGVSTEISAASITSVWDAETLQFNIDITLDYITRSKYTFIDQYDNDRGITYVIDTQPFLSDGRLLSNPNNCENRETASFVGKDWNTEYWSYLDRANGLNSINYLEYGPTNTWTLNWDIKCETITYSNVFSFNQLLGCTDKDGSSTFTFIEDANWLNLTGAFYVTLVSPLINQNDITQSSIDIGQYLTNPIGNYPISISFPKTIASIRDPGVTLFDISIFAIQYDEENSKLLVDILSYTAQYMNLINVNVITPIIGYDTNGIVHSITMNEDDSYGTECLFETNFRCFQKFQIEIDLASCPLTSVDLSTSILLDVEPACRNINGEDCTLFRSEFGAIGTTTQLTESLSYTESCDTEIYIQTFEGTIQYFTDMGFANEVDETTEFSIGSTLYVDVSVNDIGAYGVFSIDVLNVWICTTSVTDLSITSQLTGAGGCIQNYASDNAQGSNIDEIYQAFKDGSTYDSELNGQIYQSINDESVRFSLIIPSFQRNKFWLHAIVEMTLENNVRRRARLLLTNSNNGNTVNRLAHYIKDVSIVNDIIKTTHSVNSNTEKEHVQTDSSVCYYYSYFVYIICTVIIAFC